MLWQLYRDLRDGPHEIIADSLALFLFGGIGPEADGFAEVHFLQVWRVVHGDKLQFLPRSLIIELCNVHKALLKPVDDLIISCGAFREHHHIGPFAKGEGGIAEGGEDAAVLIYADGVGIVENANGQRGNQIGKQMIEPADGLGLAAPEVLIGIGGHFLPVHHLTGAPDGPVAGNVELCNDGAVHLAVVADDEAWLLRNVLDSLRRDLGVAYLYQPPDDPIAAVGYAGFDAVFFHGAPSF